jgi:hypothetical protein
MPGGRRNQWIVMAVLPLTISLAQGVYSYRDRGTRYEGLIDRPHALKKYELRGIFANRKSFGINDSTNLRLRFFLPEKEDAYVSAQEIRLELQYLMRPNAPFLTLKPGGWSEFSAWPVATVIRPKKILLENIGVIVRLKSDAETNEEIAPVVLQASGDPPPETIDDYTLYLIADAKLRSVEYQVTGGSYNHTFPYKEREKDRSVEKGSVMEFSIPAGSLPIGPIMVHIQGPYANSLTEKLNARFRFYHTRGGR